MSNQLTGPSKSWANRFSSVVSFLGLMRRNNVLRPGQERKSFSISSCPKKPVPPVTRTPAPRNSCCTGLSVSPSIAICAHEPNSTPLFVLHIQIILLKGRCVLKYLIFFLMSNFFLCACDRQKRSYYESKVNLSLCKWKKYSKNWTDFHEMWYSYFGWDSTGK